MGGDHGCGVVVHGIKLALEAHREISAVHLVGNKPEIEVALAQYHCDEKRIHIVHASEVLTMEDKPLAGLRKKKDCSIVRAVELVKEGKADAFVSPGNTGGVVTAATIRLRPIVGVERPAIATVIPAPQNEFVLLDAGANVECKPLHLAQFAVMGHVYARDVLGIARPRVGVLSVGTEDTKGNDLAREAFRLCKHLDLNFIGNVEGHCLFANGVDVVVCDGFVGNIVLKTCESLATNLFGWLKTELTKNPKRMVGAYLAKNAFHNIKRRIDPENHGGAPLLGLNHDVFISHGSARERAIMNAIRQAMVANQSHITAAIRREITAANIALGVAKSEAA